MAPNPESASQVPGAARAALALAAGLFGLALPPAAPERPGCAEPAESRAEGGHSVEVGCAGGAELRGPARRLYGLRLDVNRADARSLEILPGIGPSRARAIVREREIGPFQRVADLRRVKGIGPRTLEGLADWVEVEEVDSPGDAAPR